MKYILFLYMFFLVGCKKDKPLEPGTGNITAQLNNKYWKSSKVGANTIKQNKYQISGNVNNDEGIHRESLFLNNMVKNLEKNFFTNIINDNSYKDSLRVAFFTSVADGDVGCDYYMIIDSADSQNNFIQITDQKEDFTELWGIFSATVIRTDSCAGSLYADTLRFRDGKFHVKLK